MRQFTALVPLLMLAGCQQTHFLIDEAELSNLVLWYQGGESLLDVEGGRRSQVTFSMLRQTVPALQLSEEQFSESWLAAFGIAALPIEEQGLFKLLFLLPLGALVVAFMRIVVGVLTSGTFMPVLIAVAFLQTSLRPGLLSFVTVVGFGLILRHYLSHLNLLRVARIATLVVIVVLLISMLSVLGYRFGISTGLTITFFPMVIIAWTIERMSILWEEEGPSEVMVQGGGSLDTIQIAVWRNMLLLAARCYEPTGLGYLGANLVLDRSRGALLLELNARPGLAIQVANGCGLLPRLRAIEARADAVEEAPAERVDFVMSEFAST